jgi:hypothetical protein
MNSDDWVYLNIGDRVSVRRTSDCCRTGYIDAINHEATIFWVQLDEGRGRVLVYDGDESQVHKPAVDDPEDRGKKHG